MGTCLLRQAELCVPLVAGVEAFVLGSRRCGELCQCGDALDHVPRTRDPDDATTLGVGRAGDLQDRSDALDRQMLDGEEDRALAALPEDGRWHRHEEQCL